MQYGHFDLKNKEYVITRPDTPAPWCNYLGSPAYGAIISNNAGGYSFVQSGANGRISRYRFNSMMALPGRYIYIRDSADGDYWSATWQPVGKPLDQYKSEVRHGTGYSVMSAEYKGIASEVTYYVPNGCTYEVWRAKVKNLTDAEKKLSVFGFLEFTNDNNYEQDQVNLQYTLFITRTSFEGITHSICTLEFEDHRPLYDWVVRELEYPHPPKQIEFAKMYLTNVVTGKRYIKKMVEDGIVDGWDDPRLVSIAALRRRGFTPESIRMFVDLCGVSKSNSSVDYAMLEYCIREDLKLKRARMMAVLDPIRLVIDNYPEGQVEYLEAANNLENEALGSRKIPFGRELYIEREDFMEDPPRKYFRLFVGNEVRLMNAYFVKCTGFEKDSDGNVTVVHCTYDPRTKSGSGFEERKVKGTIHWVACETAVKAVVRLYENIIDEEKGVYNEEDGSLNLNPNSLTVREAYLEPALQTAKPFESFQFVRQGYFCVDYKDSREGAPVFNRIVSLKSSFKLPKKD